MGIKIERVEIEVEDMGARKVLWFNSNFSRFKLAVQRLCMYRGPGRKRREFNPFLL